MFASGTISKRICGSKTASFATCDVFSLIATQICTQYAIQKRMVSDYGHIVSSFCREVFSCAVYFVGLFQLVLSFCCGEETTKHGATKR